MLGIKSEGFRPAFPIFIGILLAACSLGDRKENSQITTTLLDTLDYEKNDYDLMRKYFNADSLFLSTMNNGMEIGDTSSVKISKLLKTEYESRHEVGMTESEIDAVIFSYYISKKATERFKEIESRLPKSDAEAIHMKTDSVVKSIEQLKRKLKED